METTSLNEFRTHLSALGLNRSIRALIVHSSLISFGRLQLSPQQILESLQSLVAPDCTFFVPTFTLNLQEDNVFDAETTPSQGMGVFSEYIRTLNGAVRAECPMHSYAGWGPHAGILLNTDPTLSFGPSSCFDRLREINPDLMLLGCPFHSGATHIHQVEAETGVPFRIWLNLKRTVRTTDGGQKAITLRYYGIENREKTRWSPVLVMEHLQERNQLSEQPTAYGKSYLLKISDLDSAARSVLYENANALNAAA